MIKTLSSHGNSAALIIDKPILELLEITINTPLKIITDGKSIIISPVKEPDREERFRSALEKVNSNHGETLRKLGELFQLT
jgi:antitoxin MazE